MIDFNPIERNDILMMIAFVLMLGVNMWGGIHIVRKVVGEMPGAPKRRGKFGSGAKVGILERLLVFLLILVGQWGVIGFVIAAKSIARFKELEDKAFTEYYLTGTLTSLLVATVSGLILIWVRVILYPG